MTDKPTPEQIQRACDLANAAASERNAWELGDYSQIGVFTALADTIAKLDAMQAERDSARLCQREASDQLRMVLAERDKARSDLGAISRLLDQPMVNPARAIAAPYRVETDPLVAAISAAIGEYIMPGAPWDKLRAALAKRGLKLVEVGDAD